MTARSETQTRTRHPGSLLGRARAVVTTCARSIATHADGITAIAGAGVLACAVCCAFPLLLGAAGLGTAAAAAGAITGSLESHLAWGIGALVLAVGTVRWASGRGRPADEPANAPCGCAPGSCGVAAPEPLACTLSGDDVAARARELREVLGRAISTERTSALELVLAFRDEDDTAPRVEAIAARERECCSFLQSSVTIVDGELRWSLRGPRGSERALEVFTQLAGPLAAGMTDDDARALIVEPSADDT